jgi:hypothetical protein
MSHDATPVDEEQELLAARETKLKAREAARKASRIEGLKLEAKFEEERGAIGAEFQIVDASELGEGFIVLRRCEEVLWKRYMGSKQTPGDQHDLVMPCVLHPSKERYLEIIARRAYIEDRCANAIGSLQGVRVRHEEGKF